MASSLVAASRKAGAVCAYGGPALAAFRIIGNGPLYVNGF
jgi:hypothetical protein